MTIQFNDAWDSIPLESVDDALACLKAHLEPNHPLRARNLIPSGRRPRREEYLLEDEDDRNIVWLLDLSKKQTKNGRAISEFREIRTQEELDAVLHEGYENWVQEMKDAGAWNE